MSASFRNIVQQVTEAKLEELKVQKELSTNYFTPVLKQVDEPSTTPTVALQVLYKALNDYQLKEVIDSTLLENLRYIVHNADDDPSISSQLILAWVDKVKQEIKFSLRKCEYSYLYGSLLSEWLEADDRKYSESTTAPEDPKNATDEAVSNKEVATDGIKDLMFNQPATGFSADNFRKFLSENLFNFEKNVEAQNVMKAFQSQTKNYFQVENFVISTYDVQCCIKGLRTGDLLSLEKKEALNELRGNSEALEEVASLLTIRLRNLNRWEWPSSSVSVEVRRGIAGVYKSFLNEDLITALFLQYIGVQWASFFKRQFFTIYQSKAWIKSFCYGQSIESQRRNFYESTFLSMLPDDMGSQESKSQEEYAKIESDNVSKSFEEPIMRTAAQSLVSTRYSGVGASYSTGVGGSAPGVGGSAPGIGASYPGVGGSAPGVGGSAPGIGGSAPGVGGSAPGFGVSFPGIGGSAPGAGASYPAGGGSNPGVGGSAPGFGVSFPGIGGSAPDAGASYPAGGGSYPSIGGRYPGMGGSYPGMSGSYPGMGGSYPGIGGIYPVGGNFGRPFNTSIPKIDFKQAFLHTLCTEIRLKQVIHPENPVIVVQADLESFGPSIVHDAVLTVFEFFGVSSQWIGFFKKFLQPEVKFDKGEEPKTVVRGVPTSHVLSLLFEETLLFLLDFYVNQKCNGMRIYRVDSEFWFWSDVISDVRKAWDGLIGYGDIVGLKTNDKRSGSVTVYSDDLLSKMATPIESTVSGPKPLPQKNIHWGYLQLYSNGTFAIDKKAVNKFLDEMRGLLEKSECVLEWINIFNKYLEFFIRNFGKSALVSGKQHLDEIIDSLRVIYEGLFGSKDGNPVEKLKERFDTLKSADIVDVWAYWPLERGGLGLVNPFIGIMSFRETYVDINDEDNFTKLPLQDRNLWEELRKRHEGYSGLYNYSHAILPTWTEYISKRETELSHWYNRYLRLLERPAPKTPVVSERFWKLDAPIPQDNYEKNYMMWLFSYYETQLILHFGSVKFINSKLLPMSMIANIQKSKVHH